MKALLGAHKKAWPRLPMPPADPNNPRAGVNNGRFRAYYLLGFRDGGGFGRDPDPAVTLDSTFKVKPSHPVCGPQGVSPVVAAVQLGRRDRIVRGP